MTANSGCVQLDEAGILGAGADEAHLAEQHVPELRDLVELRLRQERRRYA